MKKLIEEITGIVLFMLVVLISFACVCSVCSCNGQGVKQSDATKITKECFEKLSSDIKTQGDNNMVAFTKMDTKFDQTITITEKTSEQIREGGKVTAESIGEVIQDIDKVQNSSWMVWGIVALQSIVIIACLAGIVLLAKFSMGMVIRIYKVIANDNNNLTIEKFESIK